MSQNTGNDGLGMLREASLVLQGYVVRYYEMDPACDNLVFSGQLRTGMRVLSANPIDRSDLRVGNPFTPGHVAERTQKYNQWVTIDSVFEGAAGLVTFIAADDRGVKRHYETTRSAGWYVCTGKKVETPVFFVPITDDPKEMSDYLIKLMGDLGFENGTDAFRQTMMEAAEFASKLLQEFTKPAEKTEGPLDKAFEALRNENPDPILFEEYDSSNGGSVRIDAGSEIPADAIISTRRRIRASDLDKANTDEINIDTGEFVNGSGNIADGLDDADRQVKDRTPEGVTLTDAVSAYPTLVGDMDVTAFKAGEPFEWDVETNVPSKVLGLDEPVDHVKIWSDARKETN